MIGIGLYLWMLGHPGDAQRVPAFSTEATPSFYFCKGCSKDWEPEEVYDTPIACSRALKNAIERVREAWAPRPPQRTGTTVWFTGTVFGDSCPCTHWPPDEDTSAVCYRCLADRKERRDKEAKERTERERSAREALDAADAACERLP